MCLIGTTNILAWVHINIMYKVKRWQIGYCWTHFQVCELLSVYLFYLFSEELAKLNSTKFCLQEGFGLFLCRG